MEQFVNADLGARGLARLVSDRAAAAVKVKLSISQASAATHQAVASKYLEGLSAAA